MGVAPDYEKKAIEELKKIEPIVEEIVVQAVDGRAFQCWGWTLRISRTPKVQTPPTPEATPVSTEASHSAPASV